MRKKKIITTFVILSVVTVATSLVLLDRVEIGISAAVLVSGLLLGLVAAIIGYPSDE